MKFVERTSIWKVVLLPLMKMANGPKPSSDMSGNVQRECKPMVRNVFEQKIIISSNVHVLFTVMYTLNV
jgi:hypothetical protein